MARYIIWDEGVMIVQRKLLQYFLHCKSVKYIEYIQSALAQLEGCYTPAEARHLMDRLLQKNLEIGLHQAQYLYPERTLSPAQLRRLEDDVRRLMRHEPIQYIESEVCFDGMRLYVDESVLIPRPETEELVQLIQSDLRQSPSSIVDIGAGSGCIALSMKRHWPTAVVEGWDISEQALDVARRNSESLGLHVRWELIDVLTEYPNVEVRYDLIISNPPYIQPDESAGMSENVLDFEPHGALFVPEENPIIYYERIIDLAPVHLSRDGRIYFELNPDTAVDVERYAERHGLEVKISKDLYDRDRFMMLCWSEGQKSSSS